MLKKGQKTAKNGQNRPEMLKKRKKWLKTAAIVILRGV